LRDSKKPKQKLDPQASETFLREIDAFRRRRRYTTFTKVRPFITYLTSKRRKDDFYAFVDELEKLRISLDMGVFRFYKMAAEFVLAPGNRHYYIPQRLFDSVSYESDEFRSRLLLTIIEVAIVSDLLDNEEEIHDFAKKIESVNRHILDMECGKFSKDWFCLSRVLFYVKEMNWGMEKFRDKLKKYYQRRQRKVYPENLLTDVVIHRDLDNVVKKDEPSKKKDVIASMKKEPWFDEWEKDLAIHSNSDSGEIIGED